jgi:hypothetical protein
VKEVKYVNKRFEETLARQCAPVLLGKKSAALFPKPPWWETDLPDTAVLPHIQFMPLSVAGKNNLVFVYRQNLLDSILKNPEVCAALANLDYPEAGSVADYLRRLSLRFLTAREFPHEVGFFLGYPPADVLGFIRHKGACCKLCGVWKVYSDVEKARALFREYDRCKQQMLEYIQKGGGFPVIAQT